QNSSDARGVGTAPPVLHHLALEDPNLDADGAVRRLCSRLRVVDVGAQCVQRHTALVVTLRARDLGAAQATADLDADALGARAHRTLHCALHGAPEGI